MHRSNERLIMETKWLALIILAIMMPATASAIFGNTVNNAKIEADAQIQIQREQTIQKMIESDWSKEEINEFYNNPKLTIPN